MVRPQGLPQSEDIGPFKFALVPYEEHTEKEEEVGRVSGLEMKIEGWVHKLD